MVTVVWDRVPTRSHSSRYVISTHEMHCPDLGLQSFATQAGHNPATGGACGTGDCVIQFGGATRSIASLVLISQGISFAIMTALFTTIGESDACICQFMLTNSTRFLCRLRQLEQMDPYRCHWYVSLLQQHVTNLDIVKSDLLGYSVWFPGCQKPTVSVGDCHGSLYGWLRDIWGHSCLLRVHLSTIGTEHGQDKDSP